MIDVLNKTARTILTDVYLEYLNNYITIEKFADHNGLTIDQAKSLINLSKGVYNSDHPDS